MPEIRELQQQIDALKAELQSLKAELKGLRDELCWDIDPDDDDHFGLEFSEDEDERYESWIDWVHRVEDELKNDPNNGPAEPPQPVQIPF